MIYIKKSGVPGWYSELLEINSSIKEYEDLESNARQRLRQNFLDEQFYICGYCCGKIDKTNAHNEHIVPQSRPNGSNSLNYNNMIASCRGFKLERDTCGHRKNSGYIEEKFVSPLDQECEGHFKYYIDGEIVGKNEKAKYTIELLNLNSGALKNARRGVLKQSRMYNSDIASEIYLKPSDGKLQPLCNIVKYFLNVHVHLFRDTE